MKKEIDNLYEKFINIKQRDWIKTIREGNNGVGLTFEYLLGIGQNELEIPDYNGIEIKTKRVSSHSHIILFSCTPTGPNYHEVEIIKNTYGYPHKLLPMYNILNNSVYANRKNKIGSNFYFKLEIDKTEKKIYLIVYDKNKIKIEKSTYWDFDILEEKLNRKMKILALIKAYSKKENNVELFKYSDFNIYTLRGFDNFIELIEKGIIRLSFKLNIRTKGSKIGQIHDHGTSFEILEKDILKLYNKYELK